MSPAAGLDVVVKRKVAVCIVNQTPAFQMPGTHFTASAARTLTSLYCSTAANTTVPRIIQHLHVAFPHNSQTCSVFAGALVVMMNIVTAKGILCNSADRRFSSCDGNNKHLAKYIFTWRPLGSIHLSLFTRLPLLCHYPPRVLKIGFLRIQLH